MYQQQQKTFRTSALPAPGSPLVLAAWVPALLGVMTICAESTRTMGADHTGMWLAHLCSPLLSVVKFDLGELNHLLRKNGHFFGYGLLALCFARGWMALLLARVQRSWLKLRIGAAALGVLSAAVVASLDELHQSFLANRGASGWDVLLDTCGALLLVTVTTAVVIRRRRRVLTQLLALRSRRTWRTSARYVSAGSRGYTRARIAASL